MPCVGASVCRITSGGDAGGRPSAGESLRLVFRSISSSRLPSSSAHARARPLAAAQIARALCSLTVASTVIHTHTLNTGERRLQAQRSVLVRLSCVCSPNRGVPLQGLMLRAGARVATLWLSGSTQSRVSQGADWASVRNKPSRLKRARRGVRGKVAAGDGGSPTPPWEKMAVAAAKTNDQEMLLRGLIRKRKSLSPTWVLLYSGMPTLRRRRRSGVQLCAVADKRHASSHRRP